MLALFCYVCISDFLCIFTIVLIVAYVNLILKTMMMNDDDDYVGKLHWPRMSHGLLADSVDTTLTSLLDM